MLDAVGRLDNIGLVVASGSLPSGVSKEFYGRLAKIMKSKGIKLLLDASGMALEHAMKEGLYLFKPNLREFCELTGADPERLTDIRLKAEALARSGSCEVAAISMEAQDALLVNSDQSLHISAPKVLQKSIVGAGDSMMAGIAYQLSMGSEIRTAVAYGVACGAAAVAREGIALCNKNDAELFFEGML